MAATDVGIPEDIRDIVKGAITGVQQLVDAEALPLEQQLGDILTNERKFFREDGRAVRGSARRAQAGPHEVR